MKRATFLVAAAAMTLGVAAPAAADFVRVGSVDVGYRADMDTAYSRFGGGLEGLRFIAGRSDIYCRSIVVRFAGGDTQNVFSGRLDERRPVDVDLRGGVRRVDSIRFLCRSDEYRGGKIFIEGDVGRYRDEWRRDRDWDSRWSGIFGGGGDWDRDHRGDWDRDRRGDRSDWDRDRRGGWDRGPGGDWASLGVQSFEGRNDRESTFTGWGGHRADRVAFRAVDNDARCMSLVVTFENGQKLKLLRGDYLLQRGRLAVFDLPGYHRDVRKIYMRCRALGDWRVSIEVFARR